MSMRFQNLARRLAWIAAIAMAPAMAQDVSSQEWPRDSAGQPASGLVVIQARIGLRGQVIRSRLLQSSGYATFDRAAELIVDRHTFAVRSEHGAGTIYDVRVPVSFRPQGGRAGAPRVQMLPLTMPVR